MRGCSVGREAEAARQRRGDCGQCGGGVGNARAVEAAQRRRWMRRRQLGGGGSSGRSRAAAVAWRQRR
jgi:hypothetical protein